jgi:isopentenyl-diphosphate Delta-isomerase
VSAASSVSQDADEVVVLVDQDDVAVGVLPKLQAHRDGRLHRAVSVVLFDDLGRLLLQRRAAAKYHSGGLWSNTCCGHPRPGESVIDAAGRRLSAELGIARCELVVVSRFVYHASLGDGLVEHELDHVLIGRWNGSARPEPAEVSETRWVTHADLLGELEAAPATFTVWTRAVVDRACGRDRSLADTPASRDHA